MDACPYSPPGLERVGRYPARPEPRSPHEITFSYWARVEEVIEVAEKQHVEALSLHYIWTTDYAEARLHWKPRKPLMVLLVRVYRLAAAQKLPFQTAYAGCKSLVSLEQDVSLGLLTPVLSDEEFRTKAQAVHVSLAPSKLRERRA